jgi:hypothetical protein
MTWMDCSDITHVFEISVAVDARHFRFLEFFKMAAWQLFFIFGNHILCSNLKTMNDELLVQNTLLGHFSALFHLVSLILILVPKWPPGSHFECLKNLKTMLVGLLV